MHAHNPYLGIRCLAIITHFSANWAENLYGNSRDWYLSIGDEKSNMWCFFRIFSFFLVTFGGKMGVATMRASNGGPLRTNHYFVTMFSKFSAWTSPLQKQVQNCGFVGFLKLPCESRFSKKRNFGQKNIFYVFFAYLLLSQWDLSG